MEITIRKAEKGDHDATWEIIRRVIEGGDTYVFEPSSTKEEMLSYWFGNDKPAYVAQTDHGIVGTFILKDNFPGLGSHVANASYMTHPDLFGKGVGRAMAEYSLVEARRLGYQAMQFNIVVNTNDRAIRLWEKLGFRTIGEVPEAFNHRELGLVSASIMWRKL